MSHREHSTFAYVQCVVRIQNPLVISGDALSKHSI